MEINYNPTVLRDVRLPEIIEFETETYFARPRDYVCAEAPTSIPAWSLGRLLELIKHSDICNYNDFGCIKLYIDLDDFETCITMISYMVKEGYFNKEYLEE